MSFVSKENLERFYGKLKTKQVFVINANNATVATDATNGVSPYNASYGYTNITVNSDITPTEGTVVAIACSGSLVVASATRNVRVRFGTNGSWIPVYGTTSILAGSSYLTNGCVRGFLYTKKINTNGALHMFTDSNTTYSTYSFGIGYGTCATAAATAAKVVTLSNYTLVTGGIVAVKFTYDVPANATMNINSKGAKNIYNRGAKITADIIKANDLATFIYDGTQYQLLTIDRETANLRRLGWWASDESHDADELRSGIVFGYGTNHKAKFVGTIVAFAGSNAGCENYAYQLNAAYSSDNLAFRRRNGDTGVWGTWCTLLHDGNIGDYAVVNGGQSQTTEGGGIAVWSSDGKTVNRIDKANFISAFGLNPAIVIAAATADTQTAPSATTTYANLGTYISGLTASGHTITPKTKVIYLVKKDVTDALGFTPLGTNKADALSVGNSDLVDNAEILTSYASNNGFSDSNGKGVIYRRPAVKMYNYIKSKLGGATISAAADTTMYFENTANASGCYIGFKYGSATKGYLGVRGGQPTFFDTTSHVLIHSDNIGDYAVELDSRGLTPTSSNNVAMFTTSGKLAQVSKSQFTTWLGSGAITSDITKKDVIEVKEIPLDVIADAPVFTYTLKDDETKSVMLGTSAQYWVDKTEGVVNGEEGDYSMHYDTLSLASVVSLAKKVREHEKTIVSLEERIKKLEAIIAKLGLDI